MLERYEVVVKGETPLLMHQDSLDWDSVVKAWEIDPDNKGISVNGDDRSPAFRWIGHLYYYDGVAVIPSDCLMTTMREGGAKCPTGKGKSTYKSLTQSGLLVDQASWPLYNPVTGKVYDVSGIEDLKKENDFTVHEKWALDHGFELFCKRAKVGQNKHVRVRARFDSWAASGTITVLDPIIKKDSLRNILAYAGAYSGLCDWRPSSPRSPGPFGRFSVELKKL